MKNPLLLLALAAAVTGGCQTAQDAPKFEAGMDRLNFAIGFDQMDHDGRVYTSAAGGAPTVTDNEVNNVTTAETTNIKISGSYGIFLSEAVEVGTRVGLGFGSTDDYTTATTDFDGDGFNDRGLSGATASVDQTFYTLGGYARYYVGTCPLTGTNPWLQADFGFSRGDFSGLYYGASVGTTMFMTEDTAIEARIYGEAVFDDDDLSGVGIEFGYSMF